MGAFAAKTASPALQVESVSKSFGATQALDGVGFSVGRGEIHALLGENGAGKSTLVKVLSGLVVPNAGSISVFGQPVDIARHGARAAQALGIRTAFQEISLVPDLSIADNLLLPNAPRRFGFMVDRQEANRRVEGILERLELQDIDPRADVADCPLPIRQKLEIARAIARDPKVLLLDEPTSALSSRDVEWFARRIEALRDQGVTIVFITHRMQEVRRFCDGLTIIRNGRQVGSFPVADINDDEVVRLVIGRSLAATFPPCCDTPPECRGVPALAVKTLRVSGQLDDVSLSVWPGEIVGVGGLQGMGQHALFYALFGAQPINGGVIEVRGVPTRLSSPRDAIKAGIGVSLVPEDRKTEGLALKLNGLENVSLPVITRYSRFGWLDLARERRDADNLLDRMQVHPRALYRPCSSFSGGNQQKIAIAKWLITESRILLLFDPTRGVDVGTKHEIYLLMREFADAGGSILLYSTDVLEMVNLCDRVAVMYAGKVGATFVKKEITEEAIMEAALGGVARRVLEEEAVFQ
jgi:ribose transport system ATP-binding protein